MARSWVFVGLAACVLSVGCAAPPEPSPAPVPAIDLARFPPATEIVRIGGAGGGAIDGIFVPGDPAAPVVLAFVESPDALAAGCNARNGYPLLWHLRDLGMSALVCRAREDLLRVDAEAAYAEALRRAGSESNLVVRGASRGTLPIAELLDAGRKPAVVVLGAPMRGQAADPIATLRAFRGRKLAYLSEADEFLDADERAAIADAVQERGGRTVLDVQAGHDEVAARMHSLLGAEHTLYALAFPGRVLLAGDLFQRRVIDSPALAEPLADALARSDAFEEGLVLRWIRRLPPTLPESIPQAELRTWLDLGDPLGRLDARELDWMADVVDEVKSALAGTARDPARPALALPEALYAHIARSELDRRSRYTIRHAWSQEPIAEVSCDLVDGPQPWGAPARLNLDAGNARRQLVRVALKAAGIPERVGFDAYATPHIEVFENGQWRTLNTEIAR
ncbi:MAG: hypothetical protein IPH13_17775 [Planctomycetes bacterium]|nr:hypothetical protein [Planctomycetota bacterium]MCC7169952.1 hypothetical protein [Planctomycetota bacterium]